jgi:asparagine synthase (glutamine-hydrolysing)
MCGIWGYVSTEQTVKFSKDLVTLYNSYLKLQSRGPDRSQFLEINEFVKIILGFHRLAIVDTSRKGDQPFVIERKDRTIYCLCNGEIYEHKQIEQKYNIKCESGSDCEIIPRIYEQYGIDEVVKNIKGGEFACAIIDISHTENKLTLYCVRDPVGVRPLFIGQDDYGFCFSSNLKGIQDVVQHDAIVQMPSGSYLKFDVLSDKTGTINTQIKFTKYHDMTYPIQKSTLSDEELFSDIHLETIFEQVRDTLIASVESMLESDRPLGALLSGGLDSSLIVSIASRYLRENYGKQLHTFSIGMPGSTDRKYAEMVSKYCETIHTHIELTTEDFLRAINDVVECVETPEVTTIRASTGQYLVSKIISEKHDCKVLLIGDGSDEICSGYIYFHKAPSPEEMHKENVKLINELKYYDVLRADRGVASNGLEARVPFLKYTFVDLIMNLDPRLRMPREGMEKWLLRKAFDKHNYLPDEVLFRRKEAFSDGVSSVKNSWHKIIQTNCDKLISDKEFEVEKHSYGHLLIPNKEALYFMRQFCAKFDKDLTHVVPHYWLPNSDWVGNVTEASARVLDFYL